MVCNLTKENTQNILKIKNEIDNIVPKLREYYNLDMQIFHNFLQAMKLPKNDESQKNLRNQKMQDLLKDSCNLLIKLIKINIKLVKIGKKIYETGNKSAISDVLVAQNLFEANIRSCADLMAGNAFYIKDENFLKIIDNYLKY